MYHFVYWLCLLCDLLCDFRWLHSLLCKGKILVLHPVHFNRDSTRDWYAGIILWSWLGVTTPWWQDMWFLTSLPLTRTTNLYSKAWHAWENPRTQGRGGSTHCTSETKTDCIRRVREAASCGPHCPSLRSEQALFSDPYDVVQKCHWQETNITKEIKYNKVKIQK